MNKTQFLKGLAGYTLISFAVFGAGITARKLGVPSAVTHMAAGAGLVALGKNKKLENALFDLEPQEEEVAAVAEDKDLTEEEVAQIKNLVGGEEGYDNLMLFSKEHAPESVIKAYDNTVQTGDVETIREFLQALDASRTRILTSADNTPDTVGELIARNNEVA